MFQAEVAPTNSRVNIATEVTAGLLNTNGKTMATISAATSRIRRELRIIGVASGSAGATATCGCAIVLSSELVLVTGLSPLAARTARSAEPAAPPLGQRRTSCSPTLG